MIDPIGRSVLDAPPSRGMTTLHLSLRAKRSNPCIGLRDGLLRFARNDGGTILGDYPCGVTDILAQSRRPISTQSWVLRRSAMLTASQMPMAVSATVNASAATLASMR